MNSMEIFKNIKNGQKRLAPLLIEVINIAPRQTLLHLLEQRDDYGWSVLHYAVSYWTYDFVQQLFGRFDQANIPINDPNNNDSVDLEQRTGSGLGNGSETLLHAALRYRSQTHSDENALFLIIRGANINATDQNGYTALHWASETGCREVVQKILDMRQENPNLQINIEAQTRQGKTPLHIALENRNDEIGTLLINNNSTCDLADHVGENPFHKACQHGCARSADLLLLRRPALHLTQTELGDTGLHLATNGNYLRIVDALLRQDNAPVNVVNRNGKTPLTIAIQNNAPHIIDLLIRRAAHQQVPPLAAIPTAPQGKEVRVRGRVKESVYQTVSNNKLQLGGLTYQPIPGDGHCLYNAVALYVGQTQDWLRRYVAAHLQHNLSDFRDFLQLPEGRNVENYINDVRNGIEWASYVEIEVLMRVLDRPIMIVGQDSKLINVDDTRRFQGEPIFIYYNGDDHYDALLLTGEKDAKTILNDLTLPRETASQQPQLDKRPSVNPHQSVVTQFNEHPPSSASSSSSPASVLGASLSAVFHPISQTNTPTISSVSTNELVPIPSLSNSLPNP